MKKDSLGDRMKSFYEDRYRFLLPRRTNMVLRIDGKAFHSYTKGLKRPYDEKLMSDMDFTAKFLCENIQGAKLAYVQSDEISILVTDYDDLTTHAWFEGNLQKITSVAASMATAQFNFLRLMTYFAGPEDNIAVEKDTTIGEHFVPGTNLEEVREDVASFVNYMPLTHKMAMFDCRAFVIPEIEEVVNYFIWRQQDASRNSVSMAARAYFSHKEVDGKNTSEMQDMLMTKGVNWNNYPTRFKRGTCIVKVKELWARGEEKGPGKKMSEEERSKPENSHLTFYERGVWKSVETPIFTADREFIKNTIKTR